MLLNAMATIEAQIDFSDVEDAENLTVNSVKQAALRARDRVDRALAGAKAAGRLREGLAVVIAGPPNVGKSTLMNALAGRDVAITSPFAGTTRDLIEVFLDLRGYPVNSGRHGRNPGRGRSGRTRGRRQSAAARQACRSDALA